MMGTLEKIAGNIGFESKYKECDNFSCDRIVLKDEVYCCHACLVAHVNGYEIPSQDD